MEHNPHQEPKACVTFLNRLHLLPCFPRKLSQGEAINMGSNDWCEKHGLECTDLSDSELKILSQCLLRQKGLKVFAINLCKPQVIYPPNLS